MKKSTPKNIAIIPLRAGSKGIPQKNRKKILGRPLFSWVLTEAIHSNLDIIYLFTDDEWISNFVSLNYSWTKKIKIINRSAASASDKASTEEGMWELATKIDFDFDNYFLLQATSPLTTHSDINKAIELVQMKEYDSIVSLVNTHRFIWNKKGESLNYDYLNRPRRQDFNGLLIENGAIYACSKSSYKKTKNRLGGRIGVLEMPEDTLTEIDDPSDMLILEQLLIKRLRKQKGSGEKIEYLILDVDGVFTDGSVSYSKDGELAKKFSLVDGMGLEILRDNGIEPIIMTSENSPIVQSRMDKLQIKHVYLGVKDKFALVTHLCSELETSRHKIAYLGDDVNDLSNLISVGWGICPSNGVSKVKGLVDVILNNHGGSGAIREAVEFIVKYNKRFN